MSRSLFDYIADRSEESVFARGFPRFISAGDPIEFARGRLLDVKSEDDLYDDADDDEDHVSKAMMTPSLEVRFHVGPENEKTVLPIVLPIGIWKYCEHISTYLDTGCLTAEGVDVSIDHPITQRGVTKFVSILWNYIKNIKYDKRDLFALSFNDLSSKNSDMVEIFHLANVLIVPKIRNEYGKRSLRRATDYLTIKLLVFGCIKSEEIFEYLFDNWTTARDQTREFICKAIMERTDRLDFISKFCGYFVARAESFRIPTNFSNKPTDFCHVISECLRYLDTDDGKSNTSRIQGMIKRIDKFKKIKNQTCIIKMPKYDLIGVHGDYSVDWTKTNGKSGPVIPFEVKRKLYKALALEFKEVAPRAEDID